MISEPQPAMRKHSSPAEPETFLSRIVEDTKRRVMFQRTVRPFSEVREDCMAIPRRTGFPFARALSSDGMSFICEVKRASPSKGVIAEDFPYLDIARDYQSAGASAISVLTEPTFFRGSDEYLEDIAYNVDVPVLKKDFIVDEYQIYSGRACGASAVLLIAAILSDRQLAEYREIAESLGMSALVEVHDGDELERAVSSGADIIGVNNRNLRTFETDIETSIRLADRIPDGVVRVSESGIRTRDDIVRLQDEGYDAVLVGETLMRSADKRDALRGLRP